MYRLWDTIIEPVLEILKPEAVVEIGSEYGTNTRNLLELALRNDAEVHTVDPLPQYDVAAWQEKYGERFVLHKALSLEALPLIDRFDVVLIDGDHNWYTVYNELKLIEKRCAEIPQPFPLVIFHDVGWPYGRRDLYYDPETIPKAYRKSYEKKGMRPGLSGLVEEGGINQGLHNAVYENGGWNGVLTAVEDFLSETEQQLELIKVPGLHGLGIVVPLRLKEQSEELVKFLANLDLSPVVARYIERIEEARLETMIELEDHKNLHADLHAELTTRYATIRDLQPRLERAEQAADRDANTIRGLRKHAAAMQAQLEELRQEREALRSALSDMPADIQAQIEVQVQIEAQAQLEGLHREREALRSALADMPADATVIVVGEGDDDLLELDGRKRWYFPQTDDGAYADYHPAGSTAAIAHLEALRAKGGDYLIFPGSALWWLEHYERFRQHLESRYRVVVRQEDACIIFALRQPVASENALWWTKLEEVIAECRNRLERDPLILDWNTGLELGAVFPQHTIFRPPTIDRVLPYLDQSIDIVIVSSPYPASITEAHRVATAAVVTVTDAELLRDPQMSAASNPTVVADWRLKGEAALPTASIVIPVHNGITHTEACLAALRETLPPNFREEIIVVDDASTDETPDVLKRWARSYERLKVLRNSENAGFVISCNRGASAATGEIVIFLNNDTLPLPGWLPPLLQTFRDHPDAGAVGGKLVYPDGRLQEAGGVIFADGSGANFGRGDYEVDAPLYNYMREVDYCSGAFLATRRSLFKEVGGFDTRYRPAYYEDTDYCFAMREKGFRVYYQPESTIVHLEGAASGTDLSSGVKRYQVVNQAKFVEKWSHALKLQRPQPDRYDRETWYALAIRDEPDVAKSG